MYSVDLKRFSLLFIHSQIADIKCARNQFKLISIDVGHIQSFELNSFMNDLKASQMNIMNAIYEPNSRA